MSVEPRNRLWNRLLARAEARAAEGTAPEPHHYHPVAATEDHLRSSFENSLIYHGLKIETEFNLRLQRPPRKRKTKRKSDLPISERLRNDRAAAGSPGPTHRTPTGTPTRRISKSTPLSRPPIPIPPPLPPIPITTRAAAAREHVVNVVSDDDGSPAPRKTPVVELSDSSDDDRSRTRSTKPDCRAVSLAHCDEATDSNDTSLWEVDAILVGQPSKVEDANGTKLSPKDLMAGFGKKGTAQDFRAPYKTSKKDRARRARARKITDSDSSLAGDSDSGKSKRAKEASQQGKPSRHHSSMDHSKGGSIPGIDGMVYPQAAVEILETAEAKRRPSSSGESSGRKKYSKRAGKVGNQRASNLQGSKTSLLSDDLRARITSLTRKDSNAPQPIPVLYLSSSSDEECQTKKKPSPPARALSSRRRTPRNVSVEDKLFGTLSSLSSPRRRTRSMSKPKSKRRSSRSDAGLSSSEEQESPIFGRGDIQDPLEASENTGTKTKHPASSIRRTPLRRTSRRLDRYLKSNKRNREDEMITSGSPDRVVTASKATPTPSGQVQQQKLQKHSVEEGSLGDLSSDDVFDVDPITVNVNKIQNLPKTIKRSKSPPSSSLSGSTIEVEELDGVRRNQAIRRKTRDHDIPLSVNAATIGEHRMEPGVLEITGKSADASKIHCADSDVGLASLSPAVKKRRVMRNREDRQGVDISGPEEEEPPNESATKSNSQSSTPPSKTNKREKKQETGIVNAGFPLDVLRCDIPQEQKKSSSGSPEQKHIESQQEDCHSSGTDVRKKSKLGTQPGSKTSIPLRIRRSIFTEEGGISQSKSQRGEKCNSKLQATSHSTAMKTQQQPKADARTGTNAGLPSRNRRSTTNGKNEKFLCKPLRGKLWNSLSDRMKDYIQRTIDGEIGYVSDGSFDSDCSRKRKRRRKFAVYRDGRITEITD